MELGGSLNSSWIDTAPMISPAARASRVVGRSEPPAVSSVERAAGWLPVRGHRETRRPGEGGSLSGSKVAVGTSWPRDWMLALEVGQEPKEGGGPLWGQSS